MITDPFRTFPVFTSFLPFSFIDKDRDLHEAPIHHIETLFLSGKEVVGPCPRCGSTVTESKRGFFCENVRCSFALWKENRFFAAKKKELTKSIVSDLLRKGSTQLKGCYSPKTGTTYNTTVILVDDGFKTDFKLDFGSR